MTRRPRTKGLVWLLCGAVLALPILLLLGGLAYFFGMAAYQRDAIALPNPGLPEIAGNRSAEYQRFTTGDRLDAEKVTAAFDTVRPRLKGVRVVFVPSYLSDSAIPSVTWGDSLGYMAGVYNWLAREGISAEIAPVETEDTVAANARRLHEMLAGYDGPVCFITHSKGGLDTLHYLLGASPADRQRVRCWIAMQAPFAGSPVADLARQVPGLPQTAGVLLGLLGGTGASLDDLTTSARARYQTANAEHIRAIADDTRMLCVATHVLDPGDFDKPTSWSYPALVWMQEQGIPNDGLVPVRSALEGCSRSVLIEGLDHTGIVAPGFAAPVDQTLFMKALLVLALEGEADRPGLLK